MSDPRHPARPVRNAYLNGESIRLDGAIRLPPR
jgi:hypothetical protein